MDEGVQLEEKKITLLKRHKISQGQAHVIMHISWMLYYRLRESEILT